MLSLRQHILRFAPAVIVLALLTSCATYNQQVSGYYNHFVQGNYDLASEALDKNSLLAKHRNHLLYLLEKGHMEHLRRNYEASNRYFNEADNLMEDGSTSLGDVAISTLLNPMMETYRGEDFEKYMVHYYKALNYLMLHQPGEAQVEARRISLRTYAQQDVTGKGKYAQDAFSYVLQGLIFEKNSDINNAFIAYRNAADLYIAHGGAYYGVSIPIQLKKDLLRTAWQMGFMDQVQEYQQKLSYTLQPQDRQLGNELVLFWESGRAPVKREESVMFFLGKHDGQLFFTGSGSNVRIPFDNSFGAADDARFSNLSAIRAALPRYEVQRDNYKSAEVLLPDSSSYVLELAQSITSLAQETLHERVLKDLSKTLTRIAVGKLAELALQPKEKKKDEEETKDQKKKRERDEILSTSVRIFNFAKEKADTRNWQSLPGNIYYTRIRLKGGAKQVQVTLQSPGAQRTINLDVEGAEGLSFRSVCTQ